MTYTLTAHPNIIVRDEDGCNPSSRPTPTISTTKPIWRGSTRATSRKPYAPPETTLPETPPVEDRVADLEARVDRLEADSG